MDDCAIEEEERKHDGKKGRQEGCRDGENARSLVFLVQLVSDG